MRSETDKRRSRRVEPQDCYLRLLVRVPIVMRDVGQGGALLEASISVPPESQGHLRTMLLGRPFEADVDVCWSGPGSGPDVRTSRIGVNFTTMDDGSRGALTDFLSIATEPDA